MRQFLEDMVRRKQRGQLGEDAAARHLESKGYRILQRNWRHGRLEVDLVCRHGEELVFVEVKTRRAGGLTRPEDALGRQKIERLVRAAGLYLSEHDCWELPCRFDLVAVVEDPDGMDIVHYPDAFDAGGLG
ncbi:YraN family protein [Salidesulfovibrio onnuriiensis]|uniref:YraN family protein n=1 Tax=Salidesulfovibrio onnuriiensis TaxID=2583823 RepID=UPI0011CC8275|nr:YraN family protein [Salidesulfovibrio onnuriiensis]